MTLDMIYVGIWFFGILITATLFVAFNIRYVLSNGEHVEKPATVNFNLKEMVETLKQTDREEYKKKLISEINYNIQKLQTFSEEAHEEIPSEILEFDTEKLFFDSYYIYRKNNKNKNEKNLDLQVSAETLKRIRKQTYEKNIPQ